MNYLELIENNHSKMTNRMMTNYIGDSATELNKIVKLLSHPKPKIPERAAWLMSDVIQLHPELITKHFPFLIKKLKTPNLHSALYRNILRAFQEVEIPEKYIAEVYDICLNLITNQNSEVAVRAFAITVASQCAQNYIELKQELKLLLKEYETLPQTAAIKVRLRNALRIV